LAAGAVALAAIGRFSDILGVYGSLLASDLYPDGTAGWLTQPFSLLALGIGIAPLVAGLGWLLGNTVRAPESRELRAFAALGLLAVVGLVVEVTLYDLDVGAEAVYDRYLFYAAPLVLIAFLRVLDDGRR